MEKVTVDQESSLYEVLKVKIKDASEDNIIIIKQDDIKDYKTLLRESEVIRIIKCLDLINNSTKEGNYIFIKDIVCVSISTGIYQKSDGTLTINEIKFKRLMSSSGNVRSKKVIYINEKMFDKANEILLCGMPKDMKHKIPAKFNAYYALANTDSTPVFMPNIVVIDDYKLPITEQMDIVREIAKDKYEVNPDKQHTEITKAFDGAGLVDISLAQIWSLKNLGLDYIPSAFQFRAIPGIKGNLYTFDINKFAKDRGTTRIPDIWGAEHDLIKENINVILTKSQFKFFDKYSSFKEWHDEFITPIHGYTRTFNISKASDKFEDIRDKVLLSYQPLQSLNLNHDQLKILCKRTIDVIKDISTNVKSFIKYRGIIEEDEPGKKVLVPDYYKALAENNSLFYDAYIQGKVKKDIKKFKEKTYKGCIFIDGNYQTFIPDLVGLAEYTFGLEVKGCLKKNEVYSNYWISKGVNEISVIRFPHIANEHFISKVVNPKSEYLIYTTEGIMTNMYDSMAMKLNSADHDGDHILTNSSRVLIKEIKSLSGQSRTIAYIPLPKSKEEIELEDKKEPFKINEIEKLMKTDIDGMSANIGKVVNIITKLWAMEQTEQVEKFIKIMSVVGSLTIDFVKTGIAAKIPSDIKEFLIDKKVKKPFFMRIKYNKENLKEKRINANNKLLGEEPIILFGDTDCTMNKLCHHMIAEVGKIKLGDKKGEFDVSNLFDQSLNIKNATYPQIKETVISLKAEYDIIAMSNVYNIEDYTQDKDQDKEFKWRVFYSYCKCELLQLCNAKNKMDKAKLVDYLVYIFYIDEDFTVINPDKSILWNTFGKELINRSKGKESKIKPIDVIELNKRREKLNEKITKIKADTQEVYIKILGSKSKKDKEQPEDNEPPKEIKLYESETKYIDELYNDKNKKKLLYILMVLNKYCIAYKKSFNIYSAKKNVLNRSHIIKLSGISNRKYDELMMELVEDKVITLKSARSGVDTTVLNCTLNLPVKPSGVITILRDINQSKKYLNRVS